MYLVLLFGIFPWGDMVFLNTIFYKLDFFLLGYFFHFPLFFLIFIIDCICRRFNKKLRILYLLFSFFVYLFIFSGYVFRYVPQVYGGGLPVLSYLVGTEEQIKRLDSLNFRSVKNGDKEAVQTDLVCIIYQNNDYILVMNLPSSNMEPILQKRVLTLSRQAFTGFSLPQPIEKSNNCEDFWPL